MTLLASLFSSPMILLKKHRARRMEPAAEVMHVVANGDTISGIQANIMTSVDQQRVTHNRHRFAWILFIGSYTFLFIQLPL